jgi:hypothetical protein
MSGRRVIGSSPSQAPNDCIVQSELTSAIAGVNDTLDQTNNTLSQLMRGRPFVVITDTTLTASLTSSTALSPPAKGLLWVVIVRQNSTGGWAIVWSSTVSGASVNIDTTASTISTFLFAYSSTFGKWIMIGQPTTGMAP